MLYAALLSASFPDQVQQAAHSPEWAPAVLCLVLLDNDPDIHQQQLLTVAAELGADTERQCRYLSRELPRIEAQQRLPLAALCLPALKRRPADDLQKLGRTIDALIAADGQVELFEYAIARMLKAQLGDALSPADARTHGSHRLQRLHTQAVALLHTLAIIGHDQQQDITAALRAGLTSAGLPTDATSTIPGDWKRVLDQTLGALDQLNPAGKQALLNGLFATVSYDHQVTLEETEMLRAICAALHVPLPLTPPLEG